MNPTAAATPLLERLRDQGAFARAPLTLMDVGCRGGIAAAWRRFAPHVVGHGFDPLIDEVERLAGAERLETVHYHARYVGLPDDDPFVVRHRNTERPDRNPWARLSTARAAEILAALQPASPARLVAQTTRVGITEFAREKRIAAVDFLKIDVDGDDYAVLRSASGILDTVLGVSMEVNYFGSESDTDNTFHNVDRYLREHGFDLFAVNSRSYSHAALPAPFAGRGLGATIFGRPLQGHALYLRDLCAPDRRDEAQAIDIAALAKLAALFELFRLPDCAAELILMFSERFASIESPDRLLDALTSGLSDLPYSEYLHRFESNPLGDEVGTTPGTADTPSEHRTLIEANRRLERKLVDLKARYAGVRKKLESSRNRLAEERP